MTPWLLTLSLAAAPADPAAYALYWGDGRRATFANVVEQAAGAEVVFFGELHNNAVAHWLQLRLTAALYAALGERLVLGAEMYERDDQLVLDEFLAGRLREADLAKEAKLWPNHETDYLPLLRFAAAHRLRFIAGNVPRRYAALVARDGLAALDSLSHEAKQLFAPLPLGIDLSLPGYAAILQMAGHPGAQPERMVAAQALKDATMADSIRRALRPGETMLHFNGAYHSNGGEGILWYLEQYRPGARTFVLSTVEQADLSALGEESHHLADAVLVTPPDLTHTH